MGKIVAIGGGEILTGETLSIDREIVRLTDKTKPKALFIPTASGDAEGYWETFQKVYGKKLGCITDKLYLIRENPSRKEIAKSIENADLIYVGGGDTMHMLRTWRKTGTDEELRKAYDRGTVLSGLSAGALCWFRYASSDYKRFKHGVKVNKTAPLANLRGLNLINATCSPHHAREKDRTPEMKKLMMKTSGVGIALDDNAAIEIVDDQYRILRSKRGFNVHRVYNSKGRIHYELVPVSKSFTPLSDLLTK